MVRMIDAEKYMELLKEQYLHHKSMGDNQAARAWQGAMQLLYDMPTLTPPNEPLTIEQLKKMDGEPVYVVFLPDIAGEKLQFWALVAVDEWGEIYLMNNLGGSSAYEEAWAYIEAIYRRLPEGNCEIKACAETCDECGFCDNTLASPPEGEEDT